MLENYIVHCTEIFSFLTARVPRTSVLKLLKDHTQSEESRSQAPLVLEDVLLLAQYLP